MSEKARTAIGYDAFCLKHDPGESHPEHPLRLTALQPVITGAWAEPDVVQLPTRSATIEDICRVHDQMYVDRIRATAGTTIRLDADTVASPHSYDVALRASGALLEAVDSVFDARADNAFVAVRPPGHHAEPTHAMGFCFFNSIAVAARYAQTTYGIRRVAIVDFDVHHGNGTQSAFWDDPDVLFISSHQSPLYPWTGALLEVGGAGALGMTLNIPLSAGHGDTEYEAIYATLVSRVLEQHAPELILVSAGMDLMHGDPLAGMNVSAAGVERIASILVANAAAYAEGRVLFVLEGGYDLTNLRNGTQACLSALKAPHRTLGLSAISDPSTLGDGARVLDIWRRYWNL